nr:immunoglobulin heavy chain junction region [Mus musculus]MBK4189905.1 immunoglobulin heavy chain junction region [Mus musculus]
CVRDGWLLDYW